MNLKKTVTALLAAGLLALSACSNTPAATTAAPSGSAGDPVTIENFTAPEGATAWSAKSATYDKAPERIVCTTRTCAELLLHLGLGDKIVGVGGVFGAPDKQVEAAFDKLNILGKEYIGKEVALSVNPDFVYSRGGLFDNADWGVGTVDTLNDMGVATYVMPSSLPTGDYNSIYTEIEQLGQIFGVQEQAQAFAAQIKARQDALAERLKSITTPRTFAYIHVADPESLSIYSAYDQNFFNRTFDMVKMKNVFEQINGEVSVETLIQTDPDSIVVPVWDSYGEGATQPDPQVIIDQVLNNPKLSSLKAVKNKSVYAVDYNHLFGYGYQTLDGVELLAAQVYPELFAAN